MLRQVRSNDKSITIILPTEKRKVSREEIDSVVKIKASVIKLEFECGIHTWRAEGMDSRIKQVKAMVRYYYLFDGDAETENLLDETIENALVTEVHSIFKK